MNILSDFLLSHGFEQVQGHSGRGFGDNEEVFHKDGIDIRIVSDRGQLFVDLRESSTREWFDLPLILGLVGAEEKDELTIDEAAEVVRSFLPKIVALLPALPDEQIERLRTDRLRRRIPGLMQ